MKITLVRVKSTDDPVDGATYRHFVNRIGDTFEYRVRRITGIEGWGHKRQVTYTEHQAGIIRRSVPVTRKVSLRSWRRWATDTELIMPEAEKVKNE